MKRVMEGLVLSSMLTGCASIDFNSDESGLQYYERKPYLLIQSTADCKLNTQIIMIPVNAKRLKVKGGFWGSSDLNVLTPDGMVTSVGFKSDTKVSETLAGITGLYSAAVKPSDATPCTASAMMYKVEANGDLAPSTLTLPVPIRERAPAKPNSPPIQ